MTITLEGCPASEDSWDFAARAVEDGRLRVIPDSIDHDAPFVHCHYDEAQLVSDDFRARNAATLPREIAALDALLR